MKIYNKSNFGWGLFLTAIGLAMLATSVWTGFDVRGTVLMVACLAFGVTFLGRSFSPAMSREDKLAELDERNRLVSLKVDSLTRKVMGWARVAAMAAGLLGYVLTENLVFGCLFLFAGLSVTLEVVVAIAAAIHYEKRL